MSDLDIARLPERATVRIFGAPIERTNLGEGSSLVSQSVEVRVTIIGQEPITREVTGDFDTSGDVQRSPTETQL